MTVRIKRVYEEASADDGVRVLIDRLWPRGRRKDQVHFDHWMKDLAPSTELRRWFGHDPERWPEFKTRYFRELDEQPEAVAKLASLAAESTVTLLFGARARRHSNAAALKEYLETR